MLLSRNGATTPSTVATSWRDVGSTLESVWLRAAIAYYSAGISVKHTICKSQLFIRRHGSSTFRERVN